MAASRFGIPITDYGFKESILRGDVASVDGLSWTQDPDEFDDDGSRIVSPLRLFSISSTSRDVTGMGSRRWNSETEINRESGGGVVPRCAATNSIGGGCTAARGWLWRWDGPAALDGGWGLAVSKIPRARGGQESAMHVHRLSAF